MSTNHRRAREALRVDGVTWRPLALSDGDRCGDCGRCDAGGEDHDLHLCRVGPAWFAGVLVVCDGCFRRRVREDLLRRDLDLAGRKARPPVRRRLADGDSPD